MANFFKTDLGSTDTIDLTLAAINLGDTNLYFKIGGTEGYSMQPGSKIRAMITPNASSISAATASGLLKQDTRNDDIASGYYYANGGQNNASQEDNVSFDFIKISDYTWENVGFDLHWLIIRGTDELYGSYLSGIYSYPHNIQGSEVTISGNLVDNTYMDYLINWSSLNNENSDEYGSAPTDGPYKFNVVYKYGLDANGDQADVEGFTSPIYYSGGTMSSGIYITLPLYDQRKTFQNIPSIYNFQLSNSVASGTYESKIYSITIDHQNLLDSNKYFKNLDNIASTNITKENLIKVDDIPIDPGVISRKRLSIGINDISIKNNTYVKQGVYISPSYPLDFNAYNFSLRVDEMIPDYTNLNSYDIVQYFVEFNSDEWQRISPINRKDEYYNNLLVPKMFIFDKNSEASSDSQIKYVTYNSNVNIFRIKIVFDLSQLTESKFIPPEVRDYKCIIFDKDQFFNL